MYKINLILGLMALMLSSCSLKTPTRNCGSSADCFKDENCVLDSQNKNGICIPLKDFKDQTINNQIDQSKDMLNSQDAQLDQSMIPTDQSMMPTDQTMMPTDQTVMPTDQTMMPTDQATSPTDMNTSDM